MEHEPSLPVLSLLKGLISNVHACGHSGNSECEYLATITREEMFVRNEDKFWIKPDVARALFDEAKRLVGHLHYRRRDFTREASSHDPLFADPKAHSAGAQDSLLLSMVMSTCGRSEQNKREKTKKQRACASTHGLSIHDNMRAFLLFASEVCA